MKKIILDTSEESEVRLFLHFLNSKEYPQHRNIIFSCFPELRARLDLQKNNEEDVVKNFLKETREKNKKNIQKSVIFIKNEIEEHGEKTLEILADLMDYKWKLEGKDYHLVPTILPMSPFKEGVLYYSIYRSLSGSAEHPNVLAVATHEISHMILLDLLRERNEQIGQEMLYFIKELIAPILVYQDDFVGIFKKEIVGNYNVLEVFFEYSGKRVKAFDYFLQMFNENRAEKKDFTVFLDGMISICRGIESEIKDKRNFDNKYGMQIMKDQELLEKFREPIRI